MTKRKAKAPAAAPPLAEWLTTMALAKHLRVSRETIQAWNRKGIPREREKAPDGKIRSFYEPGAVRRWLESQGSARANDMDGAVADALPPAAPGSKSLGDVKIDLALMELRRRKADAERRELELAQRRGELLPRAEVEQQTIARILAVKTALLGLAARVTPRAIGQDGATIHAIVDLEARRILDGFAEGGN
jgi:hypothetical protein